MLKRSNYQEVAEQLTEARSLLQTSGWYNGGSHHERLIEPGKSVLYTPLGAIKRVTQSFSEPYSWLGYIIRRWGYTSLFDYNTAPGRTKEQVLTLFDITIQYVKGEITREEVLEFKQVNTDTPEALQGPDQERTQPQE